MLYSVYIAAVVVGIAALQTASCTTKEKLARDLLKDYLPYIDPGNGTVLKIGLGFICVQYDKDSHLLVTRAVEKYSWKDPRLAWRPADYKAITSIRIPDSLIWTPDVKLYNTLDVKEKREEVNTVVNSDGTILWIPPIVYRTHCSPSTDPTSCNIKIGSWTYDADNLPLELDETGIDMGMYLTETCPYAVTNPTATVENKIYPCCPEPYASLQVSFDVEPRQ